MFRNFDEVKKQLTELVEIVNGFKSEQVQLRVVEALLGGVLSGGTASSHPPPIGAKANEDAPKAQAKKRKSGTKKNGTSEGGGGSKTGGSRKGPKSAIQTLIAEGYFSHHRVISDITTYLAEKKATTISREAAQITLNRLVQNGEMSREKNAEGQFEYWK